MMQTMMSWTVEEKCLQVTSNVPHVTGVSIVRQQKDTSVSVRNKKRVKDHQMVTQRR